MANLPHFSEEELRGEQAGSLSVESQISICKKQSTCRPSRCRKQVEVFEEALRSPNPFQRGYPKDSKKENIDMLRCMHNHFNDARECLFKFDGHLKVCKSELHLFEECHHDPQRFAKFKDLALPSQREPKQYFANLPHYNYIG